MTVRELLADASKWTTSCYARRADGSGGIRYDDPDAVCWCLSGALLKCYGDEGYFEAEQRLQAEIKGMEIWVWNDMPGRRFGEVRAVIEAAAV